MPEYPAPPIEAYSAADLEAYAGAARANYRSDAPESWNANRAGHAARCLAQYIRDVGPNEPLDTSLHDLLSDLMHLCDALGFDFQYLLAQADGHYAADLCGD